MANESSKVETPKEVLRFVELVEKVRKSRSKEKSNAAFEEIVKLMRTKLEQISHKFQIPGFSHDDIFQESLFALRYKAIKDYDMSRSTQSIVSPFDKFAVLCIRRHLSTKLKSAYQNKQKVWISSVSLDQDRNSSSSEESLFLVDIMTDSEDTILDNLEDKEYYKNLFSILYEKLSDFEKRIFRLYRQKLSYSEITKKINKADGTRIKVKSVDNGLSRIKLKAKDVFKKHGEI